MTAVLRIGGLGLWSGPKPPRPFGFTFPLLESVRHYTNVQEQPSHHFFKTLQSSCQSCPLCPKMHSSRTGRGLLHSCKEPELCTRPRWLGACARECVTACVRSGSDLAALCPAGAAPAPPPPSVSAALDMAEVSVQVRFPTAALVAVRDSLVAASGWLGCSSNTVHVKSAVPAGPLDSSPGAALQEDSVGSPFWWPRARSLPWPHSDLISTQFPVLNLTSASNS